MARKKGLTQGDENFKDSVGSKTDQSDDIDSTYIMEVLADRVHDAVRMAALGRYEHSGVKTTKYRIGDLTKRLETNF